MKTPIKLVRVLLILVLAVCLGQVFLSPKKKGPQAVSPQSGNVAKKSTPSTSWPDQVRPQDLAEGPLFQSSDSDTNSPALQARTAEEFGYELVGTLVTSTTLSRAIFLNTKTQETITCQQQEALENATLLEIHKDRVVLQDQQGERFVLLQSQYRDSGLNAFDSSQKRFEVPTKNYPGEQFYNGLDMFLQKAKFSPVEEQGQIVGLKVSGLNEVPFAEMAGLQDGDVIVSINNQTVSSRQKALQVFKKSKSMSHVDLDFVRNNSKQSVSFNLP